MATKLGRMVTYLMGSYSSSTGLIRSRDKLKSLYLYYCSTMVTYFDRFPPIKSHDPLMMWSREIT